MASSLATTRVTIEERFKRQFTSANGAAIIWANTPDDPPTDGSVWVEPSILWGQGDLRTKDGRNTIVGVLNVNVFAPAGTGTGTLFDTADDVRDIYNRVEVSGVRFGIPSGPRLVPVKPEARWVQANVSIPFTVDETVT